MNRANEYYEDNREVLTEKAKNKYRELSEEEKHIKTEYGKADIIICLKKRNKD